MKKLLLLLGAGSSSSQGMPCVDHLNGQMKQWAADWDVFDGRPLYENFYAHTWKALETHFKGALKHLELQPNFEVALGQMLALSNWVRPAPHGNPLRLLAANGALPPGIRFTDL